MTTKTSATIMAIGLSVVAPVTQAATINLDNGTKLDIYGYAKLDLIYDVDAKMGPIVNYGAIRVDDQSGPDGHADLHVYETRLGFKTTTPTDFGNVETVVEGEFYGGGGGEWLLNHAYVKTDRILAGQTWSNFSNFIAKTPTIDFLGGVGQTVLDQQPQLRYMQGGFSAALERPGNLGGKSKFFPEEPLGTSPTFLEEQNSYPDLTMQYQSNLANFNYGLSGVVRNVEIYNQNEDDEESEIGYGVGLSVRTSFSETFSIQGSYLFGDGIGTYLYGNPAAVGFYESGKREVDTIEAQGVTLGVSYNGLNNGQINLAYGMVDADYDNARSAGLDVSGEIETISSIYINYLWTGSYGINYGVEVGNHKSELADGRDGDATRIQGMVKYAF